MIKIYNLRFTIYRFWHLFYLYLSSSKFFFFPLLFLFYQQNNFAQTPKNPFVFKQSIDGNGTLSNIVNCFLEDSDGFVWIGTGAGLKRFEGGDYTVFKHEKNNPNSLAHNEVEALYEDRIGNIWVGTGRGISYFDKKKNKFFNFKEFDKNNNLCFNIMGDHNGEIWFSIRKKGLFRYSLKDKKLKGFPHDPTNKYSITNNRIFQKGIVIDPLKRGLWLETEKGINFFDFKTNKFFNRNNNPNKLPVFISENTRGLALDGNNLIYFDTDAQKIIYYNVITGQNSNEILVKNYFRKENIEILYIFVDNQHRLWLSDWFRSCYFLDIKTNNSTELINDIGNPNSISSNSFWCAYQQKDGTIWLGTNNGISYTNPQREFYQIYDLSALYAPLKAQNQLYAFMEDSVDSTFWLAINEQQFGHFYPETNLLETFDIPQNRNRTDAFIRSIFEYQNDLYVVSTNSVFIFDKKHKTLNQMNIPESLQKGNILSLAKQIGDSLLLFGDNAQAYCYKFQTKNWYQYPILTSFKPDLSSSYPFLTNIHQSKITPTLINTQSSVSCAEVDNDGGIWIAIQNTGLAKFSIQKQAFELIEPQNEADFRNLSFSGMRKDKEGDFWIGTYGLLKFNPKTKIFTSELEVNVINDLIIDKYGKIWTTAYNDFTILDTKTKTSISKTLIVNKGNLLWSNSLYLLKNGKIASLMKGTLAIIDPENLIPPSTNGKVLISKIQVYGSEILLHHDASRVNFAASENVFIVYFSTVNISNDDKFIYKYQLAGYQNDWVSTNNEFTSFADIAGGDYIFKVKKIDSKGNETPISTLNIHIDTPFYKSKWFLIACALAFCGLVYAFFKFRSNQMMKIQNLKMQSTRLEKDKSEIQYQNLINHLNPHFLFNSLTSLNSLIMTEPKLASKFLQKLSLIYRYILQNKEKDVVSLNQELNFVKNYIDLQKSRFEEGLQININVENEFLNSGIVPVTLQNLFENAIKHNTLEESKALIINVYIKNKYLYITNNLQKKKFVETSNNQGLESLKSMYKYLTEAPFEVVETQNEFIVKVPLL